MSESFVKKMRDAADEIFADPNTKIKRDKRRREMETNFNLHSRQLEDIDRPLVAGDKVYVTLTSLRRNIHKWGVFMKYTNHRNPELVRVHLHGNKRSQLVDIDCVKKASE